MTAATHHRSARGLGAGARALVAPVVVALLCAVAGCSDAHTPEEKAWVDDGIDPRVVTVFVPPRFAERIQPLMDAYVESVPAARLVLASAPDAEVAERIAANPGPSVWIGAPDYLDPSDGAVPDPDAVTTVAQDPLALAWSSGDPGGEPALSDFAGSDRPTGLCAQDLPCGQAAHELLADAGIEPAATETFDDPDELARALRDGGVTGAVVHRSFAAALYPGVGSRPLDAPDHHPIPVQVWRFGDADVAVGFEEWLLAPAVVRELQGRLWIQPPTDVAPPG